MRRRSRTITLATATGLVAIAVLAYEGFVAGPNDLRIVRETIPCRGLTHGPVRILLFSDVDFPHYRDNLERVAREARAFDPDLVLIAGDFLDRAATVRDPAILRDAVAWFDTLPAPGRRLLSPGEAESPSLESLQAAWPRETVDVTANERRRVTIRGEPIDLFVADPFRDPGPWRLAEERGRSVLEGVCRSTETHTRLQVDGSEGWSNVEITLAFRPTMWDTRILLKFAADPSGDPWTGPAWTLVRDEDFPAFRLIARFRGDHRVEGRTRSRFIPVTGAWTKCRVRVEDDGATSRVRARFWRDGDDEPAGWAIDASGTGPDRRRFGTIALGGERGRLQFADLSVTDLGGSPIYVDRFDDPKRFRAAWRQWSKLGAWLADEAGVGARLVLAHSPDIVRDIAAHGGSPPALVLAGHTHGGQIRLPLVGPVHTGTHIGRRYNRGRFDFAGIPLFITAGVGTSVVPVRLGVPPDAALITLVPEAARGDSR